MEKIDFMNYSLVSQEESQELFELQQRVLADRSEPFGEKVVQLAMILTQAPIADYQTAIRLLHDFSLSELSFNAAFLGGFFDALWPFIEPNPFLPLLEQLYQDCDLKQRALIKFAEAVNIDNKLYKSKTDKAKVRILLSDAIDLCDDFVYAYYRLALVSKKADAKALLKKALNFVRRIYSDEEIAALPRSEVIAFDFYLETKVIGTSLTMSDYNQILHMLEAE